MKLDNDEKYTIKMISLIAIGIGVLAHIIIFSNAYYPWLSYQLSSFFQVPK